MMTNLFSMFDPSSSLFSSNWLIVLLLLAFLPTKMWKLGTSLSKLKSKVTLSFKKEIVFSLNKSQKGTELMLLTTFIVILVMNFLALYPQVFSATSHLTVNLPLSLILWLSLFLFGWLKNTNYMLSHLLPQGTPGSLMMFMVMIEMVSNLIRPITLSIRLTANLIAGHLLMSLLGNSLLSMTLTLKILANVVPVTLTILETAVACIQAYVFMTLVTLYLTEMK